MNKPGIDKNTSLALKLNGKMFWEQFSAFLGINILLIVIIFIGSIIFMENTASNIAEDIEDAYTVADPQENVSGYKKTSLGHYQITFSDSRPKGHKISNSLRELMPDNISDGERKFSYNKDLKNMRSKLKSIKYHIITATQNEKLYMDITTDVGIFYIYVFYSFIVLIIIQIITLLNTALSTKKAISKALEPLRELSQATQAFSNAANGPSGQYSPEALKNLAYALNTINASHLDTRIPSDIMTEELKPLAAAINNMLNRINESYDSQVRFVSDASHELRTPIAVIQGYADLLSRWGTEDKNTLEESIQAIRSEAESMKQLVNQLLFLARGDADSMQLDWKELNLTNIVSEVVKELDMIDKTHEFATRIEPGIMVKGDVGLLKQLLRILTDNSLKYTPDGGKITIKLYADDMARIVIQDEGVGIPEDVLPHIFDRFVRADESRARNTGGAGLGLSIGKWVTEKHGGHLEVLSREGIGTRFTVVLPVLDTRPVIANHVNSHESDEAPAIK